jgi:acyl-CoA synthetase (AMP-forming)/AMP-acid ligase II
MLIVGGVNVFPDQIANLLAAHPAVQERSRHWRAVQRPG